MLRVIEKHRAAIANIDPKYVPSALLEAARLGLVEQRQLGFPLGVAPTLRESAHAQWVVQPAKRSARHNCRDAAQRA